LHHGEDGYTSETVTEQDGQRTGLRESASDTEEETSTDGTTKSNELDVSGFQTKTVSASRSPRMMAVLTENTKTPEASIV
jgi:hypothetical protein